MKILVIVLVAFIAADVCAQDYTFKVLINKGQNSVKHGNSWSPIKVGASLNAADELKVSPNGYIGLVHASGKPLEVKESGQHKVADLAGRIKAGTSVLNKYTDFILSAKTEKAGNLTATGAVTRGDEIKLFLPDAKKAIVLNDEIIISWTREAHTPEYVVQFTSMFGDELERFQVKDTTLMVNLGSEKFANEDNIVVKVFSKKNPNIDSEDYVIKKLSSADRKRLEEELNQVSDLLTEKTALNQFYLANFYEENTLLIDASTAYQNAIRMAPQVADFKQAFDQFVARNKMK